MSTVPWTLSLDSMDIVHTFHGFHGHCPHIPKIPWTMSIDSMENVQDVHGIYGLSTDIILQQATPDNYLEAICTGDATTIPLSEKLPVRCRVKIQVNEAMIQIIIGRYKKKKR